MTCPTGGAPNINYGNKNYGKNNYGKKTYGKNGQSLISQEKSIMEKMELWKKKGSDHFRDILNPYGEKSNYGKIGRRRRLSKLNVFFFSIILSVTIFLYYKVIPKNDDEKPKRCNFSDFLWSPENFRYSVFNFSNHFFKACYMGVGQYLLLSIPMGWTSINPSYFDVNYRGFHGFWPIAI